MLPELNKYPSMLDVQIIKLTLSKQSVDMNFAHFLTQETVLANLKETICNS